MKTSKRIAFEYLSLGVCCVIVACALSLVVEEMRYVAEPNVHSRPIDDFWTIIGATWFAAVLNVLLPTGWVFWAGFGFALKKKSPWFYLASAVPALFVGWFWPRGYWALMSV